MGKIRIRDGWKKELQRLCIVVFILIALPTVILLIGSGKFRYQYIVDFSYLIHLNDKMELHFSQGKDYSELDDLPIDQNFIITGNVSYNVDNIYHGDFEINIISGELDRFNFITFERWGNNFLDSDYPGVIINQNKDYSEERVACGSNGCFKYLPSTKEMPKCWLLRSSPRSYNSLEDEIQEGENPNNCKLILLPYDNSSWSHNWVFSFRNKGDQAIVHISQPERKRMNMEPYEL